jgi:hypothetical protein
VTLRNPLKSLNTAKKIKILNLFFSAMFHLQKLFSTISDASKQQTVFNNSFFCALFIRIQFIPKVKILFSVGVGVLEVILEAIHKNYVAMIFSSIFVALLCCWL